MTADKRLVERQTKAMFRGCPICGLSSPHWPHNAVNYGGEIQRKARLKETRNGE